MSSSIHLWNERKKATIKIRAKILEAVRSWFRRHKYVEVQGPVIVPAVGNWADYFELKYFGSRAYLTHGLQPYTQVLMANLGRIYTIAPVFRAEKVRTNRHLTEYWLVEAEIPHCDLNSLIKVQEQLVSYICRSLSKECEQELEILERDAEELGRIHAPFRQLRYDDAIDVLQRDGFNVEWGAILEWEHERHLSLQLSRPFFISEFPVGIETFFCRSHPQRPGLTMSVDLFAPEGYGEISSGGQPVVEEEELLRKMREVKVEPDEQEWYMSIRATALIPCSAFALGVERLTQWICKLEHIEETIAFPRLRDNIPC